MKNSKIKQLFERHLSKLQWYYLVLGFDSYGRKPKPAPPTLI